MVKYLGGDDLALADAILGLVKLSVAELGSEERAPVSGNCYSQSVARQAEAPIVRSGRCSAACPRAGTATAAEGFSDMVARHAVRRERALLRRPTFVRGAAEVARAHSAVARFQHGAVNSGRVLCWRRGKGRQLWQGGSSSGFGHPQ